MTVSSPGQTPSETSPMLETRTQFTSPLNRFVKCLWHSEGESNKDWQQEQILPTGSVDLIFKLQNNRPVPIFDPADNALPSCSGSIVSGAYSRPFTLDTSRPAPTIRVHFHPGGAAAFLGVPVSELMNLHLSLEELWGP
ncbi:DUF6597 domain-containing transcriptional factor [Gimesia sp.]|uniref:DUF6597 domain-containing transcriptional factor n=1 Tax=Gimesia sp. TaxID=2024833 RepID=UPI003A93FCDF